MFKHHPDGHIVVGASIIPLDMWLLDEPEYEPLPAGYIGKEFVTGVRHFIHTDNTAVPRPLNDAVLEGYLAKEIEYARAAIIRQQMALDGREPIGLPGMRFAAFSCPVYAQDALHEALKAALGTSYLATLFEGSGAVLVALEVGAPAGAEAQAQAVIDAHNPAFLLRSAPTLPNDGIATVRVTVHVPKATEGTVVSFTIDGLSLDNVPLDATLSGEVTLVSTSAAGTKYVIGVVGYAHDPVTVEVVNG